MTDKNTFIDTKVLIRQINNIIKRSTENWALLDAQQTKELSMGKDEEVARLEGKKRIEEGIKFACTEILTIINTYED